MCLVSVQLNQQCSLTQASVVLPVCGTVYWIASCVDCCRVYQAVVHLSQLLRTLAAHENCPALGYMFIELLMDLPLDMQHFQQMVESMIGWLVNDEFKTSGSKWFWSNWRCCCDVCVEVLLWRLCGGAVVTFVWRCCCDVCVEEPQINCESRQSGRS